MFYSQEHRSKCRFSHSLNHFCMNQLSIFLNSVMLSARIKKCLYVKQLLIRVCWLKNSCRDFMLTSPYFSSTDSSKFEKYDCRELYHFSQKFNFFNWFVRITVTIYCKMFEKIEFPKSPIQNVNISLENKVEGCNTQLKTGFIRSIIGNSSNTNFPHQYIACTISFFFHKDKRFHQHDI